MYMYYTTNHVVSYADKSKISGNSNLADRPITNEYREARSLSDTENVHEYQLYREAMDPYLQRTSDIAVVNTGIAEGVKTFIVQPCAIFGVGTGLFNKYSIPFPSIMRMALKLGQAPVLGPGVEPIDYVHIEDLVEMYELLLSNILSGADIPSGERGIYFCENGSSTWRNVAERVGEAGVLLGVLKTAEVMEISSLERWAELASATSPTLVNDPRIVELGFAGRASTKADLARQLLGWTPKHGQQAFDEHFEVEMAAVIEMQAQS
jgi:nucleoside-diphosphate-sugar epimerase